MSAEIRVAVVGASGRMGAGIVGEVRAAADLTLVVAVERVGHSELGKPVYPGGPVLTDDLDAIANCDVVIDFSVASAVATVAAAAAKHRVALVTGTTGVSDEGRARLAEASAEAPIVAAPNMSVGVNVLLQLVETAVRTLGCAWDVEIAELHHGGKRDAPSGTALALARTAAQARELDPETSLRKARVGDVGLRDPDEIGVVALRGGDVAGEHTVFLLGRNERLELTHRATQRSIFVTGALRAARWVVGRPPALYTMKDVLFGVPSLAD